MAEVVTIMSNRKVEGLYFQRRSSEAKDIGMILSSLKKTLYYAKWTHHAVENCMSQIDADSLTIAKCEALD